MKRLLSLVPLLFCSAYADYSTHPAAEGFLQDMQKTGYYSRAEVLDILRNAQRNPSLIESEQKAPERTRTWPEYRSIFIKEPRIRNGLEFMRTHADTLARAQAQFGLPPQVITAIIGVETLYGGYTGPHRVLDSLATQGFEHPRRSPFFYNEFKEFLMLCKERPLDPLTVKGSYAGAMGLPQFMPSNYRKLALDYDADGSLDLWTPGDAIGSAANYLLNFQGVGQGWKRDQAVAFPVLLKNLAHLDLTLKSATYTLGDIRHLLGPIPAELPDTQPVGVVELNLGNSVEHWLALPNFYSIMSYNPRVYYAMAVFHLSEAIANAAADAALRIQP